jgi:hypothetical protein
MAERTFGTALGAIFSLVFLARMVCGKSGNGTLTMGGVWVKEVFICPGSQLSLCAAAGRCADNAVEVVESGAIFNQW